MKLSDLNVYEEEYTNWLGVIRSGTIVGYSAKVSSGPHKFVVGKVIKMADDYRVKVHWFAQRRAIWVEKMDGGYPATSVGKVDYNSVLSAENLFILADDTLKHLQ